MTQGTATRSERRKARTVQAILQAAEDAFVRSGYRPARIEDIAAAADVSVGSIYVHFGNKAGLYLGVVERALSLEEEYLAAAGADGKLSPAAELTRRGERYLCFYLDHPGHFRLLTSPPSDLGKVDAHSRAARRLVDRGARLVDELAAIIERGIAEGEMRRVDAHRAARFLWGAWNGVITLHLRPDRLRLDDSELQAVLDEGRRLVTEGLQARAG